MAEPGNELRQSDSSMYSFMPSMYSKTIPFARHNAGSIDFEGHASGLMGLHPHNAPVPYPGPGEGVSAWALASLNELSTNPAMLHRKRKMLWRRLGLGCLPWRFANSILMTCYCWKQGLSVWRVSPQRLCCREFSWLEPSPQCGLVQRGLGRV